MPDRQYLCIDQNNAENKVMPTIWRTRLQSAVTNGHWCGGKRPQCGASAASLS